MHQEPLKSERILQEERSYFSCTSVFMTLGILCNHITFVCLATVEGFFSQENHANDVSARLRSLAEQSTSTMDTQMGLAQVHVSVCMIVLVM